VVERRKKRREIVIKNKIKLQRQQQQFEERIDKNVKPLE
jgi:hypothetical protein